MAKFTQYVKRRAGRLADTKSVSTRKVVQLIFYIGLNLVYFLQDSLIKLKTMRSIRYIFLFSILSTFFSCRERTPATQNDTESDSAEIKLMISISQRQLYVIEGDDTVKRYAIAVGKQGHPTPQGDFKIHQIDWNPDWTPPDSEWSKDETYKKPGEAGNPMGRARIIYQMPYTIHGTTDLESLGEAESHGSVRMANTEVIELARFLMERSGTNKPEEWFDRVLSDSTSMESVELARSIPLTNVE